MSRRGWTLLLVCVATFMLLLDVSVVTTALPSIRADLGASFTDIQWTLDAYTLPLAAALLPAASLADITGRKRVFLLGMAVFTLASAACAAAGTPLALNVARAFQGVGGALLFAVALPLLGNEFRGRDRAGALGVWGGTLAASVAIGPLVGGLLTDGLSWHWIFLVNVPVGMLALIAGALVLRESRDPSGRRVDLLGLVLLGAGLTGIVYGVVRGNAADWGSSEIVAAFAAGGALLAAFLVSQWRQRQPMLDLRLFTSATFTGGMLVAFLFSAGLFGVFAYLVIFLQSGVGYSALGSGLRFLPLSIGSFVLAAVTGRALIGRFPIRWLLTASMMVTGIGVVLMLRVGTAETWQALIPGLVVTGIGTGMSTPLLAEVALAAVPPQRAGMATGAVNTARQVGVAVGVAVLGALFEARVRDGVVERISALVPPGTPVREIGSAVAAGGTADVLAQAPPDAAPLLAQAARSALADGLTDALTLTAALVAAAALAAVLLVRRDAVHPAGGAPPTGTSEAVASEAW
ncbi:MAG: MFS transporter [Kineosporiaceae bacterium]